MLISHRHKFIFIHVYKVAGTSINRALQKYVSFPVESGPTKLLQHFQLLPSCKHFDGHITARELKAKISSKIFDRYFKFAFVRNPWDWQISLYEYILVKETHYQHEEVKAMSGFEEFIEWKIFQEENKSRGFQKNFVTDENGNMIVDFVGKYENLRTDFDLVLDKLALTAELPHLNKGNKRNRADYYSTRTRKLVEDYYSEDIELFGYSFLTQTRHPVSGSGFW